jgi:hypothetical protein
MKTSMKRHQGAYYQYPQTPSCICLALLLCSALILLPGTFQAAASEGKQYVDKKAGFRVQLPPGWKKVKSKDTKDALAAFATRDEAVAFAVARKAPGMDPEEFLTRFGKMMEAMSVQKISEEVAVVSGLPARKLVFRTATTPVAQMWMIVVLSNAETWFFSVGGPESILTSPQEPRNLELQPEGGADGSSEGGSSSRRGG